MPEIVRTNVHGTTAGENLALTYAQKSEINMGVRNGHEHALFSQLQLKILLNHNAQNKHENEYSIVTTTIRTNTTS
jgi:hypothetical protein